MSGMHVPHHFVPKRVTGAGQIRNGTAVQELVCVRCGQTLEHSDIRCPGRKDRSKA